MMKKKKFDGLDVAAVPAVNQAKQGHAIYMELMDLMTKRFDALRDHERLPIMMMTLAILVEDIEQRVGRDALRSIVDEARAFRESFGDKP